MKLKAFAKVHNMDLINRDTYDLLVFYCHKSDFSSF